MSAKKTVEKLENDVEADVKHAVNAVGIEAKGATEMIMEKLTAAKVAAKAAFKAIKGFTGVAAQGDDTLLAFVENEAVEVPAEFQGFRVVKVLPTQPTVINPF